MFSIEVLDNGRGGHDDIVFSIDNLLERSIFDTYWLIVGADFQTFQEVKNAVAGLLANWKTELSKINTANDTIYLAIDISDQYIGCIRVSDSNDFYNLSYGYTENQYFENGTDPITDFKDTESKSIHVSKNDFLNSIELNIDRLNSF